MLISKLVKEYARNNYPSWPYVTFHDLWGHTHLYENSVSYVRINSFDRLEFRQEKRKV